jgi:hypothetical protein
MHRNALRSEPWDKLVDPQSSQREGLELKPHCSLGSRNPDSERQRSGNCHVTGYQYLPSDVNGTFCASNPTKSESLVLFKLHLPPYIP